MTSFARSQETSGSDSAVPGSSTIVETAVSAGSFGTLVAAVQAAGLVETLSGPGPFTVFAPTDEAFAKLPAGTVETLLKPENKALLVGILTYHVVPRRVPASAVKGLQGAKTVNGQRLDFAASDAGVTVDSANVVKSDIGCSNGIVHVIDSVLMPEAGTIVEVAKRTDSFGTLLAAANAAGLVPTLSGNGPMTIFAPTDEAFLALPRGTVASLLQPGNKSKLAEILKYHVVVGRVYSEDALSLASAPSVAGPSVSITPTDGGANINNSNGYRRIKRRDSRDRSRIVAIRSTASSDRSKTRCEPEQRGKLDAERSDSARCAGFQLRTSRTVRGHLHASTEIDVGDAGCCDVRQPPQRG